MRYIVYGAGAVGGVIGGRLHQAGREVVFIARGAHYEAIRTDGLRVEAPMSVDTLAVGVVGHPDEVDWRPDDTVLLAVKSQDTAGVLGQLAQSAPETVSVFCMQNGVANEPMALRLFEQVYGVCVMCPSAYLHPGVVHAYSEPVAGILDLGRYPSGRDDRAAQVSQDLGEAGFLSDQLEDVRRWKYRKLVTNLGTAVEAVCGPAARRGVLGDLLRDEAETVLAEAGIDVATPDEDAARRADHVEARAVGGVGRPGGSLWQSLHRSTGAVETDFLNGEIVMLGRLSGVPAPANALVQRLANRLAHERLAPGHFSEADVLAMLDGAGPRAGR
jgi:2-dehydropantoate 2-reductase